MRAVLLVALLGAAVSSACDCPAFFIALAEGKNVAASGSTGQIVMPPCCKDLAAQKAVLNEDGSFEDDEKHTPGAACSNAVSGGCATCTLLAICRWSEEEGACYDGSRAGLPSDSVSSCKDVAHGFQMAEVRPDARDDYDHLSETEKETLTETPHVAEDDSQWPQQYDGYLPPSGCIYIQSMTKEEINQKYPSGLPGCDDYVNEGYSANKGHMTTDIVSDPRLPVETHKPNFPLGANPKLPDGMIMGGDFDFPQPDSPWVKPAFNQNGCLGGPCDPVTQHACTGLSCSHLTQEGETTHNEKKGSMYKRKKKDSALEVAAAPKAKKL